jgi:hypothetical protein
VTHEPRTQHDYGEREINAARRVLVDLGQVLGSFFGDSIVVVGGWVPYLLLPDVDEPHVGSIDVDLALDVDQLQGGRYAKIVQALLATGRYQKSDDKFRLTASVDPDDGGPVIVVAVDFLKAPERRRKRPSRQVLEEFRPIDADGCAAAFREPESVTLDGTMISGVQNQVSVRVAAIEDFLVMKAYALAKRDKPKDAYDICYCLDQAPGGFAALAHAWRERLDDPLVSGAIGHLRDKFGTVTAYGPQQVAAFYDARSTEDREARARRAFELVDRFLALLGNPPVH